MSFFDFLEKLQQKPEGSRKKIAIIAALAIMALIAAVWLTTFNLKTASKEKITAPFNFIKEDVKNFYGFFKNK